MGTRAVSRQLLLLTARKTSSPVFSHLQLWIRPQQPPCIPCRLLCTSRSQSLHHLTQQSISEPNPSSGNKVPELSKDSLLDMGFTETQAEQIHVLLSEVRGGSAAKHALSTLTALFVLGLNPSSVLKLLEKCPEVASVKESLLQQRIANLRKLGLVEGSLQRVVAFYPPLLTVPVKNVKQVVLMLREKCLFTVQHVTDILRDSPAVVVENQSRLQFKFQYVFFRMGVKHSEMVKSRLFRFTLEEVRCRHCFLERRGLYETPDKKGQTIVINPKLERVLSVSEDAFVTNVAMASAEEYDVFKRLMEREWREEEQQMGSAGAEYDDDWEGEEEDEDEDEEEAQGKSSYRKRRKK